MENSVSDEFILKLYNCGHFTVVILNRFIINNHLKRKQSKFNNHESKANFHIIILSDKKSIIWKVIKNIEWRSH